MLDIIMNLNNFNIYLIVFFLTILDHSGVAIGILSIGIFISLGKVNFIIAFIIINVSLIISDFIFMIFGKLIAMKYKNNRNYFSRLHKINIKILSLGGEIISKQALSFYLFGKFVPYIGKFLPLFMGYQYYLKMNNIILLFIGNSIYTAVFIILGMFFGNIIIDYSFIASIICIIFFILLYNILLNISKKNNEKK